MKRLALFLLLLIPAFLHSQDLLVVDSLSFQLETEIKDETRINTLWELSDLFKNNDFKKSLAYANTSLKLANRNDNLMLRAFSYMKIGDLLLKQGLYNHSLDNYLQSKKTFEETNSLLYLSGVEHNIGNLFYRLHQNDKALEYFKRSLELQNKSLVQGDSSHLSQLHVFYISIGNCYVTKGNYENAKKYFQKALERAKKFDDKLNLGVIYNNLGKLFLKEGDKMESLRNINLSLSVRENIDDKSGMASSYLSLSEYYDKFKDYKTGLDAAQKGLDLAILAGARFSVKDAYLQLSTFYRKLNKSDEALNAYMKFHQYSDSLINEASVKEVTSLQMQYKFDKLEKEREMKQQKREMIYSFLIAILVLGIIIIGLLYGFIKNRAGRISLEKQSLEKDLEVKNKELTTNVMYLLKNNELIGNISKRLLNLKPHLKKENIESFQKIIFDLRAGADHDVWKEFELRFEQVHLDFYRNLKAIAPDMTPAELKICAFLKLNMNSKEISSIIHQSVKSVEVKRSRIRKKLNLTNTDTNLILYLNEL